MTFPSFEEFFAASAGVAGELIGGPSIGFANEVVALLRARHPSGGGNE